MNLWLFDELVDDVVITVIFNVELVLLFVVEVVVTQDQNVRLVLEYHLESVFHLEVSVVLTLLCLKTFEVACGNIDGD